MVKFRIPCVKYNSSLDSEYQVQSQFEAFIELSKDHKYMQITNRKRIDDTKYVLEPDKYYLKERR